MGYVTKVIVGFLALLCEARAADECAVFYDPIIENCMCRSGLDRQPCDSCISRFTQGMPNCSDLGGDTLGFATCRALDNCTSCGAACRNLYIDKVNCMTGPPNPVWCLVDCYWAPECPLDALWQCAGLTGQYDQQDTCWDCIGGFGYLMEFNPFDCKAYSNATCAAIEGCACLAGCGQEFLDVRNCWYAGYCSANFTCPPGEITELCLAAPTGSPTSGPTLSPSTVGLPTGKPTDLPTAGPTSAHSQAPTSNPTESPTGLPNATQGEPAATIVEPETGGSQGLSTGAIVGIAIGGVAAGALVATAAGLAVVVRRGASKASTNDEAGRHGAVAPRAGEEPTEVDEEVVEM